MSTPWTVKVTVAAVIEHDSRFLMVREHDEQLGVVINQPAGHLEHGESPQAAAIREVQEETGHIFRPEAVVGIYLWDFDRTRSYLRIAFCGTATPMQDANLDPDIIEAAWLTRTEIEAGDQRNPMVVATLQDYLSGRRLPLEAVSSILRDRR